MKAIIAAAAFSAVLLLLPRLASAQQLPARQRMVIVLSFDGFPADSLEDAKLPVPTLRRLQRNGVSARMTAVNPTVTWPNHTSMVTGVMADRHGLLANGTIVSTNSWPPVKVEPMIEKQQMVHVPTVYDVAAKAGLTTAQVDWVAIHQAPGIRWAFPEWAAATGPLEAEMIRKGVITAADVDNFSKANILYRDQIWTTAAAYLIREHQPNLLLVHLLSLDTVHHQYGTGTLAATAAIAFLDSCVARLVDAVRDAGLTDRTTFLIVSDHGFRNYTKQIRPAVALAAAGLAEDAYVLPEGGAAYVYVRREKTAALTPHVKELLQNVEGIDKVHMPGEEYVALGLPQPEQDPQMSQLYLTAKPGYSFVGTTGGPVTSELPQQAGSHGYPASDPALNPIFIASGYGVQAKGQQLAQFPNVDVAATIAQLLGLDWPAANGKPIPLSGAGH